MIFSLAGALLVPILLGFLVVELVWPAGVPAGRPTLLKLSLAVPMGLGLSSVGFFLWLMAFGSNTTGLFAAEIVTFLVVLAVSARIHSGSDISLYTSCSIYASLKIYILSVVNRVPYWMLLDV